MSTAATVSLTEVYRFLSLSMQYPDRRWLDDDYISLLYAFLDELGWSDQRTALASLTPLSASMLEALQVEHTRLFINSIPHVLAPPYGSHYLDSGGSLYGATAEKTRNFYRRQGFDLVVAGGIPDSLTLELQFLSFMHEQGHAAEEQEFLRTLFRPWFVKFQACVQKDAHSPFYKVVVRMIDFFTMEDE